MRRVVRLAVEGTELDAAYVRRPGRGPAVVFVPGLGCSAADLAGALGAVELLGRDLVLVDPPGAGGSSYPSGGSMDMLDLAAWFAALQRRVLGAPFVLVGHSLGGLLGLLYAESDPANLVGFVNVEGNLAPEDCLFTRGVAAASRSEFGAASLRRIADDLEGSARPGPRRYAAGLSAFPEPLAYYDFSRSIVALSDGEPLLERFLALELPRVFVHGADNAQLSYLDALRRRLPVVGIEGAGHFPFHDAPEAFYGVIGAFVDELEREAA